MAITREIPRGLQMVANRKDSVPNEEVQKFKGEDYYVRQEMRAVFWPPSQIKHWWRPVKERWIGIYRNPCSGGECYIGQMRTFLLHMLWLWRKVCRSLELGPQVLLQNANLLFRSSSWGGGWSESHWHSGFNIVLNREVGMRLSDALKRIRARDSDQPDSAWYSW